MTGPELMARSFAAIARSAAGGLAGLNKRIILR